MSTAQVIAFPDRMAAREPWITKRRVAVQYSCSTKTIERWVTEGCPSRLDGGRRMFRLSDVEAWLEQRRGS